jgi:hypothetical protein
MRTKYIIDNKTGQTINGSLTINGDLSVTGSTPDSRPYKVYTALLTQSGESSELYLSEGSLVIGQTYKITEYYPGDDFTNVGAPSNAQDMSFVATGTTPAVWTNGSSLYTNGGAPVVTVLENTIGNIWFEYKLVGVYHISSDNLFTDNKTSTFISQSDFGNTGITTVSQNNSSLIVIVTYNYSESRTDGILAKTAIEIRVYN